MHGCASIISRRRRQTPKAILRRELRAYDAMVRRAARADRSNSGLENLCAGQPYERWIRARAHAKAIAALAVPA